MKPNNTPPVAIAMAHQMGQLPKSLVRKIDSVLEQGFSYGEFTVKPYTTKQFQIVNSQKHNTPVSSVRGEQNAIIMAESLNTANRLRFLGLNALKCISEADDILILLISAVESFVNKETPSDEDLEQAKAVIDSYRLGE